MNASNESQQTSLLRKSVAIGVTLVVVAIGAFYLGVRFNRATMTVDQARPSDDKLALALANNRPVLTSYGGTVTFGPTSVQGVAGLETTFADMPPADCKEFLSEHASEFDEIEVEGKMIKSASLMPSLADIADACSRDRSSVIIREVFRDASGTGALMVEAR